MWGPRVSRVHWGRRFACGRKPPVSHTVPVALLTSEQITSRVVRWGDRLWVQAALIYLGLRLVSWLLLAQAADQQTWDPRVTGPSEGHIDLALSWDAKWYERIASTGYPDDLPVGPDGRVQQNEWAFYPLFPLTVRLVMSITSLGFATVAPLLALLAGLGAAIVLAHLLRRTLPGAPTGAVLGVVAVWAAFPASPVLQMAYTESFGMLLLLAFLLLLIRERWWWAAACALLLGLTRPIALPVLLVVCVAVGWRWAESRDRPFRDGEPWALGGLLVATGVSGLAWTAIAWLGTGRRDAYPATMTAWRGEGAINVLQPWLDTYHYARDFGDKAFVVPTLTIAVALGMAALMLVPRFASAVDLRLRVWTAAYAVYLLAVVDGTTSILRYTVPLFPVAIVLVGAHRARLSRWWQLRTAFWVVAGIVGQVGWIWWLVLFQPPSDFPP